MREEIFLETIEKIRKHREAVAIIGASSEPSDLVTDLLNLENLMIKIISDEYGNKTLIKQHIYKKDYAIIADDIKGYVIRDSADLYYYLEYMLGENPLCTVIRYIRHCGLDEKDFFPELYKDKAYENKDLNSNAEALVNNYRMKFEEEYKRMLDL